MGVHMYIGQAFCGRTTGRTQDIQVNTTVFVGRNEAEAMGDLIRSCTRKFPGWSITEPTISALSDDYVLDAAELIKRG